MRHFYRLALLALPVLGLSAAVPTADGAGAAPAASTSAPAKPSRPATFDAAVLAQVAAALDLAEKSDDFAGARARLETLFDQLVAHATDRHVESFRETAFALRLVTQLEKTDAATRAQTLAYLRQNDALGRTLAMLLTPRDDAKAAYALLGRLREKRPKDLNAFATLAAAVCVVHDRPMARPVNENLTKSADPVEISNSTSATKTRCISACGTCLRSS